VEQVRNVTLVENVCSNTTFVGIMIIESMDSFIEGNICEGNEKSGIRLYDSLNITVKTNHCNDNMEFGISMWGARNNAIIENRCERNGEHGIDLFDSDRNLIQGLLVIGNEYGIYLMLSDNNRLLENDCLNNSESGIYLEESKENDLTSNNCSKNKKGIELFHFSADNTIVSNFCLWNFRSGISVQDRSEKNIITNNSCIDPSAGIQILDSDYNLISGNHVSGATNNHGIHCLNSDHLVIDGNECEMNHVGISIDDCSQVQVRENICLGNYYSGIMIQNSDTASILNNTCSRNEKAGIFLDSSNLILNGNVIGFNDIGIIVTETSGTTIQFNEIYGNREYGIEVGSWALYDLSAEWNWWGDASGPYHLQENPSGLGDRVSDKVIFSPWLDIGNEVPLQTTYFVSVDGDSEKGDGTQENPFSSIKDTFGHIRRGDTIRVFAGVYYERFTITDKVTIIGNGSMNTIIDGGGFGHCVRIDADGVTISDFMLRNSYLGGYSAGLIIHSDGNLITNVVCTDNGNGISVFDSKKNVFEGVSCHGNTENGLIFVPKGSAGNVIRNSWFYNNGGSGVDIGVSVNTNISQCTILNNSLSGISITNSIGLTLENNSISHNPYGVVLNNSNVLTIVWNDIFGNGVSGILIDSSAENIISNNSITFNTEGIIAIGNYSGSCIGKCWCSPIPRYPLRSLHCCRTRSS